MEMVRHDDEGVQSEVAFATIVLENFEKEVGGCLNLK